MKLSIVAILLALGLASASRCRPYKVIAVIDTAHNRKGLEHTERRYRALLGGDDNGNEPGGQRSINWDADIVPFKMPGDFFRFRGAIFSAKKGEFRVSNPPDGKDNRFSTINPRSSKRFSIFSKERLFTPLLENQVTTSFVVANKKTRASVRGFGAIFTDVDFKHTTVMTFRDRWGCTVARIAVPPKSKGLSFVGIVVKPFKVHHGKKWTTVKDVIASVHLKLGNTPISAKHVGDVVVVDDLIYGEPKAF